MSQQHTLGGTFTVRGTGLHSGAQVSARLSPAPAGTGRVFVADGQEIRSLVTEVWSTQLATTLGDGRTRVALVEHLSAALYALGIDNVKVEVEGGELPVLDGSAQPWVERLLQVGVAPQNAARHLLRVTRPVEVQVGGGWAQIEPADRLSLDIEIDFPHPAIRVQRWTGVPSPAVFAEELAWARTFGFFADAERLRAAGHARGASLENTLIFDEERVLNPDGARAADEPVRHKALDALGDLSLLGARLVGRLRTRRAGHAVHIELLRTLLATEGALEPECVHGWHHEQAGLS